MASTSTAFIVSWSQVCFFSFLIFLFFCGVNYLPIAVIPTGATIPGQVRAGNRNALFKAYVLLGSSKIINTLLPCLNLFLLVVNDWITFGKVSYNFWYFAVLCAGALTEHERLKPRTNAVWLLLNNSCLHFP